MKKTRQCVGARLTPLALLMLLNGLVGCQTSRSHTSAGGWGTSRSVQELLIADSGLNSTERTKEEPNDYIPVPKSASARHAVPATRSRMQDGSDVNSVDCYRPLSFALHYGDPKTSTTPKTTRQASRGARLASLRTGPVASESSFSLRFDDSASRDAEEESAAAEGPTKEQIAEAINNPLGNLWILFTQTDVMWFEGDRTSDTRTGTSTKFMPVMPVKLTEDWSLILRPVFQYNSFEVPSGIDITSGGLTRRSRRRGNSPEFEFGRESGLGDTILMTSFSNQTTPPWVFGFGPTFMFPTATDDALGTEKWAVGPSVLGFYIGEKWIIGGVVQHWWSYAGKGDRDAVNLTDLQYVVRYRLTPETNIGFGPNIQYDWDNDELTLPVGLGGDTLIMLGKLPVKVGAEFYYYADKPDDFGPEWTIRLLFVPVIPSPEWSKKPLFGS